MYYVVETPSGKQFAREYIVYFDSKKKVMYIVYACVTDLFINVTFIFGNMCYLGKWDRC